MDQLKTLQADLTTARDALKALQDELPQFHALLTDNENEAQRLKTSRAPLDEQAQAKGRVNVAREMLEQHQSDIASAQAEVARLERLVGREDVLTQMADHAQAATKHGRALEAAVNEGSAALGKALAEMGAAFVAIRQHREDFALLGRELAPEFNSRARFDNGIQSQAKKGVCEQVARDLEERGVTLTDVLNSATGRHTPLDIEKRALPMPENAELLWQLFAETVAKRDRHIYHDVYLPVKKQAVTPIAAPNPGRYGKL